ncbi:MAG: hypothetical protein ACO1QB_06395, partial [Verrucomicrobiales bacterium]
MNFRNGLLCGVALSFWAATSLLRAELPLARLNLLSPAGGQVGSVVVVTLQGTDLDDAKQLIFSDPKIIGLLKLQEGTTNVEPGKFVVSIPADVEPGYKDVRMAGRFGISNPRPFAVSSQPQIAETGNNHSFEAPMEVSLGTVINGVADAAAADYFYFNAASGKKLLIRCDAEALDSRLAPVLVLQDSSGKELARSRRKGLLEWTPKQEGKLILRVFDQVYRGGPEYFYRLEIGHFPHVDFVEPSFASSEGVSKHKLLGRNLTGVEASTTYASDGRSLEQDEVEITSRGAIDRRVSHVLISSKSSGLDGTEVTISKTNGISNPFFITFVESAGTNSAQTMEETNLIRQVTLPCHVQGMFVPGKSSGIVFKAKKGEVHWVEVLSDRLGSPTDPLMLAQKVVTDDKGAQKFIDLHEAPDIDANLGGVEWDTSSYDARWRFEVKEDGEYRVLVRDLFNRTKGKPSYPYQLSVRPESPDFRLVALPVAPPDPNKELKIAKLWTTFLRKGESQAARLAVFREHNFGGEIQLNWEGLPAGVDFAPKTIPAGVSTITIIFSASTNAASFAGQIKLKGTAAIAGKTV